jgi:hypothetical protein
MEGLHCFNPPVNCNDGTLVLPVQEYDHSLGKCSVIGGYVYRGAGFPDLQGVYFYADLCSGEIWGLRNINGQWINQLLLQATFQITTFGQDEAGELYLADYTNGMIFRIGSLNLAERMGFFLSGLWSLDGLDHGQPCRYAGPFRWMTRALAASLVWAVNGPPGAALYPKGPWSLEGKGRRE